MPDRFGPRGVIALLIPPENANIQPEYEAMRPEGVSNQIYRFSLARHDLMPEAPLVTATDATVAALKAMGAKRIAAI